ncbi:MAG: hypothetical protein M3081_03655 [Gemmatimonadota bacterium]|nr:hypothetical protein [Gemmatimonadota bacterium]
MADDTTATQELDFQGIPVAYAVELASLNVAEHEHVVDAVHDLGHVPTQEEIDQIAHDAVLGDAHRVAADALQHEQAIKAEEHDYAGAQDLNTKAGYELHEADHLGTNVEHTLVAAEKEGAALANASLHQEIANDHAVDAAAYAASGDPYHAADSAHLADDHATVASDYGHQGDHGGSSAIHDSSHDTVPTETDGSTAA